jgi:hypothetical protein
MISFAFNLPPFLLHPPQQYKNWMVDGFVINNNQGTKLML